MEMVQLIQSAVILWLAFVPIRKDNEPEGRHNKCMPGCNYCLTVFLFLVTPALNVIVYIALLASGAEAGPVFSYLTFYSILSVLLALHFFISLLDVFESEKVKHAVARNASAASLETQRELGQYPGWRANGKVGTPMRLREDMYSLMFASMVKSQYKKYCDLAHETGVPLPVDADEPEAPVKLAEVEVGQGP